MSTTLKVLLIATAISLIGAPTLSAAQYHMRGTTKGAYPMQHYNGMQYYNGMYRHSEMYGSTASHNDYGRRYTLGRSHGDTGNKPNTRANPSPSFDDLNSVIGGSRLKF